jgi:hypothetical protein
MAAPTDVYAVTFGDSGEWFEDIITWNLDDLVWGDLLSSLPPTTNNVYLTTDVTAMVLDEGKVTLGLTQPTLDEGSPDWHSKEATGDIGPKLVVIYEPDTAYALTPFDGEVNVHPDTDLAWISGAGSVKDHLIVLEDGLPFIDVELDASIDPNIPQSYEPGELAVDTTYTWHIESLDGPGGTVIGETDVHTFTTMAVHPDFPVSESPFGDAVVVPEEAIFRYSVFPGAAPTSYNLYVSDVQADVETLQASAKITGVPSNPADPNVGTDARSLIDYAPLTTYYYRFEGVNGSSWPNPVESFTTAFYVGIDNFEDFTSTVDGISWTGGSLSATARNGASSYAISAGSTATCTFSPTYDMSQPTIDKLVFWVRGDSATGSVTVAINGGSAVTAAIDVTDTDPEWQDVSIPMSDFGVALNAVSTLDISLVGTGTIQVDDIRIIAPVDDAGLLGYRVYYPFDVDTSDASPAGDDLTIYTQGTGTGGIGADAVFGAGALALNAPGELDGARAQVIDTTLGATTGLTVSMWLKEDVPNPSFGAFFIEGTDRDPNNKSSKQVWDVSWKPSSNEIRCVSRPAGTLWIDNSGASYPSVLDGTWHHVAVTHDSVAGVKRGYVDGELRVELDIPNDPLDNAIPMSESAMTSTDYGLMVGCFKVENTPANITIAQTTADPLAMTYKSFFDGSIDEVVAYTTALTPAEIDKIFREGVNTTTWDLNGDGVINLLDFAIFSQSWQAPYDLNDLQAMAALWLLGT